MPDQQREFHIRNCRYNCSWKIKEFK